MTSTDIVMVATHDHRLVALSVIVSILAAYAAIALAERIGDAVGLGSLGCSAAQLWMENER
jgi:NO-binding membrane sensor protein with MHYT domain